MFLTKLPVETRQMIYKMVIVGDSKYWHVTECRNYILYNDSPSRKRNTVRVFKTNKGRMREAGVALELLPNSEGYGQEYTSRASPDEVHEDMLRHTSRMSDLSLTQTCRQIYLETINIPYGEFS